MASTEKQPYTKAQTEYYLNAAVMQYLEFGLDPAEIASLHEMLKNNHGKPLNNAGLADSITHATLPANLQILNQNLKNGTDAEKTQQYNAAKELLGMEWEVMHMIKAWTPEQKYNFLSQVGTETNKIHAHSSEKKSFQSEAVAFVTAPDDVRVSGSGESFIVTPLSVHSRCGTCKDETEWENSIISNQVSSLLERMPDFRRDFNMHYREETNPTEEKSLLKRLLGADIDLELYPAQNVSSAADPATLRSLVHNDHQWAAVSSVLADAFSKTQQVHQNPSEQPHMPDLAQSLSA